jgi:hypothetical protein
MGAIVSMMADYPQAWDWQYSDYSLQLAIE